MVKPEDAYTEQEIALNKELLAECLREQPDFERIALLLEQGADPLGATGLTDWHLFDHVYGEVLLGLDEQNTIQLPRITELFLHYGMDMDRPRIPYDDRDSLHPMWHMALLQMDEYVLQTLKLLLDHGLSADAAGRMWRHCEERLWLECGDPGRDEVWNDICTGFMKCLMLTASYDHVCNNDEELRSYIGCSYNHADLLLFRAWNDFDYHFDTSHCGDKPQLTRSVVTIVEKNSGKEVWKAGILLEEGSL